MTRRLVALAALLALTVVPASAYLKYGARAGTRTINLHWVQFPIRYFVTNRDVDQVSASQFQGAIGRAFSTWHAVPNTPTSSQFVGFTSATPSNSPGATVLGFESHPEEDRALAITGFTYDTVTGEIVEADIFFNTIFSWSTAQAGSTGRFDVESIALHELGHLFGLSHSALGETELRSGGRRVLGTGSVMFPIAFSAGDISDRTLKADDIAGFTDIYGNTTSKSQTGSISGRVTKNGRGVVGAHIVAFSPSTGKLVGGFSLSDDGSFTIAGLELGPQVLRAEPLDDADIESFFDASVNVDLNFQVKLHDRLIVVPRGGGARNVEITVNPK